MDFIETLEDLHSHYGTPKPPALLKVASRVTPAYGRFIEASRFCLLSTVGPEGTDCSPRGDQGPVVRIADPHHLLLPDWQGNDRIDSLRNLVRDPRASLTFLVLGYTYLVRVNGMARLTVDADLRASFEREGKHPRSVVVLKVGEVYSQCARALQRSALWGDAKADVVLPSVGEMLQEASQGEINAEAYDTDRAGRAHLGWW